MAKSVGVFVVLLVTVLAGWLWGASERSELNRALSAALWRNDLLEARTSLLGARVNLCDADLGGMSRQLENARKLVERASVRLGTTGLTQEPGVDLGVFSAEIDEAQRLVSRLIPGAGTSRPR